MHIENSYLCWSIIFEVGFPVKVDFRWFHARFHILIWFYWFMLWLLTNMCMLYEILFIMDFGMRHVVVLIPILRFSHSCDYLLSFYEKKAPHFYVGTIFISMHIITSHYPQHYFPNWEELAIWIDIHYTYFDVWLNDSWKSNKA